MTIKYGIDESKLNQNEPDFFEDGMTTPLPVYDAETVAAYTLPVINLLNDVKPDLVIGCDRGARLYSVAVHAMWHEVNGSEPFPSMDSKIHFLRISKSARNADSLHKYISVKNDIDDKFMQAKEVMIKNDIPPRKPKVIVLDDWTYFGYTFDFVKELVDEHDPELYFAVMWKGVRMARHSGEFNITDGHGALTRKKPNEEYFSSSEHVGIFYDEDELSVVAARKDAAIESRLRIRKACRRVVQDALIEHND